MNKSIYISILFLVIVMWISSIIVTIETRDTTLIGLAAIVTMFEVVMLFYIRYLESFITLNNNKK